MTRRFSIAAWLAALAALALSITHTPARPESARNASAEGGAKTINCFGTRSTESCVVTYGPRVHPHIIAVPQPQSAEERAAAEARDRRWVERCRPAIRQDQYGMPRYSYAAQGCEYGRLD